jgi:hypothetical protein
MEVEKKCEIIKQRSAERGTTPRKDRDDLSGRRIKP